MQTVSHCRKEDLAQLRSLWKEVWRELRRAKRAIGEEIRTYPTPIPRCDAQFNHLDEQRGRLARELDRIDALSEEKLGYRDYVRLIEEFIASAAYTDDSSEQELRSRLGAELSLIRK